MNEYLLDIYKHEPELTIINDAFALVRLNYENLKCEKGRIDFTNLKPLTQYDV